RIWRGGSMKGLVPPHGGALVERGVAGEEASRLRREAGSLTPVPVSDADLSTVYRFGDGVLSPLNGPMDSETYNRVLDESVVQVDGRLYAWTIPIALPVTEAMSRRLGTGETVALVD